MLFDHSDSASRASISPLASITRPASLHCIPTIIYVRSVSFSNARSFSAESSFAVFVMNPSPVPSITLSPPRPSTGDLSSRIAFTHDASRPRSSSHLSSRTRSSSGSSDHKKTGRGRSGSIVSVQEIRDNYDDTLDQGAITNLCVKLWELASLNGSSYLVCCLEMPNGLTTRVSSATTLRIQGCY